MRGASRPSPGARVAHSCVVCALLLWLCWTRPQRLERQRRARSLVCPRLSPSTRASPPGLPARAEGVWWGVLAAVTRVRRCRLASRQAARDFFWCGRKLSRETAEKKNKGFTKRAPQKDKRRACGRMRSGRTRRTPCDWSALAPCMSSLLRLHGGVSRGQRKGSSLLRDYDSGTHELYLLPYGSSKSHLPF